MMSATPAASRTRRSTSRMLERSTVSLTSSDPAATLPAPYAYATKDVGQHTFTGIVLRTVGNQTITATDSNGFTVQSPPIAVSAS